MLVLFETAAGYAIFKLLDEKKLQKSENLYLDFETPAAANKVVKLKEFYKFNDTTEALAAATASLEGQMTKRLKKMLKKLVVKEAHQELAVSDAKLGNAIKDKLNLQCVSNSSIHELMRGIRSQMDSLLTGLPKKEMSAMALGLAHSLSRYKLKFSPDKVDTMIIQAISLLDDLDKELNNYIMRGKEWYGWHFPELSAIVTDYIAYAKVVQVIGDRTNTATTDLSHILTEDLEQQVKEAAEISMGTEVSDEDIVNIKYLCEQVVEIAEYRTMLYDYLKNRMMAIAPNLTILVGELVGARLVAHAGSLMNLAKHPASTVQILGAEKALFRALKAHHDTPKYGMIYHASLVSQANVKYKGKMSRMLAAKTSLSARVDALSENANAELGAEHRAKLEIRLKQLEQEKSRRISGMGRQKAHFDSYSNKSEIRTYNSGLDSTIPRKRKIQEMESAPSTPSTPFPPRTPAAGETKEPKKKKIKSSFTETPPASVSPGDTPSKAKKKKSKSSTSLIETPVKPEVTEAATPSDAKKKKSKSSLSLTETPPTETKKKKKRKSEVGVEEGEMGADAGAAVEQGSDDGTTPKKTKKATKHSATDDSLLDITQEAEQSFVSEGDESAKKKKVPTATLR